MSKNNSISRGGRNYCATIEREVDNMRGNMETWQEAARPQTIASATIGRSGVYREIQYQSEVIDALGEIVSELSQKISPVRKQIPDGATTNLRNGENEVEETGLSTIAAAMHEQSVRVANFNQLLREIIESLDI